MKRILIIFLLLLISFSAFAFAEDIKVDTITFNGSPIIFNSEVIIKNNQIFVPMREFFESLDAQVYWFDATKQVVAYRDNMFVKLQIDSTTAYKNGKSFSLEAAPFIEGSTTYVPVTFVASAFDLEESISEDGKTYALDTKSKQYEYTYINKKYMQKYTLDQWGVEISLPPHWYQLSEDSWRYGYITNRLSYEVSLKKLPLKLNISLSSLADIYMNQLSIESAFDLTINEQSSSEINGVETEIINYQLKGEPKIAEHFLYFMYVDGDAYVIDLSYGQDADKSESLVIFDEILSTFQIYQKTIDQNTEHYFETLESFRNGLTLSTEIYANMTRGQSFPIQGRFTHFTSYDGLIIEVKKPGLDDISTFYLPIEDTAFSGRVYLPYGLGIHNIEVYGATPKSSIENPTLSDAVSADENIAMREKLERFNQPLIEKYDLVSLVDFSAINLSIEDINFLYPTPYLDTLSVQVNSNANLFSYKSQSTYSKAKSLYKFVIENFESIEYNPRNFPLASETIESRTGDPLEISMAYVAMLRSINIPARIAYGLSENIPYFWVEVYYNGNWSVVDMIASLDTSSQDFFHQNYHKYRGTYTDTKVLDF